MLPDSRFNQYDRHPRLLTDTEIADPMLVLHQTFDYAHLPDLRRALWDWLQTTVSGNFNTKSLHYKDRESMLALYERMQKLLEAAHLLLVAQKLSIPQPVEKSNPPLATITEMLFTPTADLQSVVEQLVQLLSPDFIFNLGSVMIEAAPVYYFVVALPGGASRSHADCQALAEAACAGYGTVQLLITKTPDLQRHLQEGHLLFSRICTEPYLLYRKEEVPLAKPDFARLPKLVEVAEDTFDQVHRKAQEFYEGAIFYFQKNNHSVSVFLLQQAAEHLLRGLWQAITHRNCITHDLIVLRRQALPFYPELTQILPVGKDKSNCLLHRLGKAYVLARYNPGFTMPVIDISQVKQWVENLLTTTRPVLVRHLHTLLRCN